MGVETINVIKAVIDDVKDVLLKHETKHIIWYGYTPVVDVVQQVLKMQKIKQIDCVVDSDHHKWGSITPSGFVIAPPKHTLESVNENTIILILSNYAKAIENQVREYGYQNNQIIVLPSPGDYTAPAVEKLSNGLSDDKKMSLRELQLCELEILKELRSFCDKNNLRYYLAGGTCYGAENYSGFVPHDDDVDVYMPYEDYIKLIETYTQNDDYEILYWANNDKFFWPYVQMSDKSTVNIYGSFPITIKHGVVIDIIPLTGWPESQKDIDYRIRLNRYMEWCWKYYNFGREVLDIHDNRADIEQKRYDISTKTAPNIATAAELWGGEEQWILPNSAFDYGKTLTFEKEEFSVPSDYKGYLKLRHRKYEGRELSDIQVEHPVNVYRR